MLNLHWDHESVPISFSKPKNQCFEYKSRQSKVNMARLQRNLSFPDTGIEKCFSDLVYALPYKKRVPNQSVHWIAISLR